MAENQHGAPVIDGDKPVFYPSAYRVLMKPEQIGDILHRVVAMDFHESVIRLSFSHGLPKKGQLSLETRSCIRFAFFTSRADTFSFRRD